MTRVAGRWQQHAIVGGVGTVFVVFALLPLFAPVIAFLGRESTDIRQSFDLFASSRPWVLLANSLGLSGAVVVGALAVGTPMGLLLTRTDVLGRRAMLFAHGFPMFLPPYLLALGWFYLYGLQGYLGGNISAGLLFHPVGHIAILSLAFAPVVTALVALGLWNLDPSLEEAARVAARPFRVAIDILLPAAWPSVALSAILVFALSFSEMGVPMFLRIDVYPAAIFARLGGIDYNSGEAFLLSLPLLLVALAMVTGERWLFRNRPFDIFGLRRQQMGPLPLGRWRGVLSIACWGLTILSLLPIVALFAKAASGVILEEVGRWVGGSLVNSLLGSGLAATIVVGIGAVLGHARARELKGSRFLDLVGVLAFVAPAMLLGIGIIAIWNRPSTSFIYGGIGVIVIGYVARYSIVAIRTVAVAVAQSPLPFEHAAAAYGAGFIRRFVSIVLPMHKRTLAAAWILAAVFCLRDLETAVIYYPPDWQPLTVRIFTLEANGPEAVVAGLAVVQVVVTMVLLAVGVLVISRRSGK